MKARKASPGQDRRSSSSRTSTGTARPILCFGSAAELLEKAGIPATLPDGGSDPGLLRHAPNDVERAIPAFAKALALHRHFERETDPPLV